MLKRFGFLIALLLAITIFVPAPQAKAGWGVAVQVAPAYPAYPPAYSYPDPYYNSVPYDYYAYPAYPPGGYYSPGYVYPYVSPYRWGGYGSRGYYYGGDRYSHNNRGGRGEYRGGGHRR